MTIAIKFGDTSDKNSIAGVIYFDAVTAYVRQYGGKVTEHPLEAGASITDHYISNNKKFNIEGVISGVDFASINPQTLIDGEPIYNVNNNNQAVSIPSPSLLDRFIPDVVNQFLGVSSPDPILSGEAKNYNIEIEKMLSEILHGLYFNEERGKWENRMTLVTLFELDGSNPINVIDNLAITSFSVKEDAQSGDAMFFDMSLEQVTFVKLESAEAPKPQAGTKTARATTEKTNTGNVNSSDGIVGKNEIENRTVMGQWGKFQGGE